jgi:glycine/D-amino acid oxidase-like deaminating enzyme/nitrite reductase/ring-hydroxylating ferredoxin subunit
VKPTISLWLDGAPRDDPRMPVLDRDAAAEVCVVGAGIAGLTTAYLLCRAQRRVVVVDALGFGQGETLRTTAHLVSALDDRFYELERIHGRSAAKLAAASHAAAIDRIESICRSEGRSCGFERVDGYLFAPSELERGAELLQRELAAARAAGLEVEAQKSAPIPGYDTGGCLRFAGQAQLDPRAYLELLADAILRDGGRIATRTHVRRVEGGRDAAVYTSAGPVIRAASVVVATNTPVNDWVTIHTKQAAYRTYVVAAHIAAGSVPRALYWDGSWEDEPYHYVRLHAPGNADGEYLIVGGEDHKTGQADDGAERFERLERWMRQRFPAAGRVAYRWSGQVMEPADGLGLIGRNPLDDDNVYVATGDSGTGMTHGTIAGMLISDQVLGRSSPWAELYDPSRKPIRAAGEFARENLNVAAQYGEWLSCASEAREPAPGEGLVFQQGLKKIARYRDESGALVDRSAVCPHMGCIVRWNSTERSWDCPCHGSRFDAHGRVIHGPAIADLAPPA